MTDTTISQNHGFSTAGIRNFFSALGRAIMSYAEHRSRYDEVRRLHALTDEELAQRGLTRDGIAAHVFRDVLWV